MCCSSDAVIISDYTLILLNLFVNVKYYEKMIFFYAWMKRNAIYYLTNWTLRHGECPVATLLNLILNDRLVMLWGVLVLSQSHNHKSKI